MFKELHTFDLPSTYLVITLLGQMVTHPMPYLIRHLEANTIGPCEKRRLLIVERKEKKRYVKYAKDVGVLIWLGIGKVIGGMCT